ncbi:hypothetical protein SAMN05216584_10878 [Selenomonas sp. WCT3]|uniref:hypothetical protein n=1 Tax=Selenomonas sp. WCT3 TaxID=3158785 RepID=UPI00088A0E93|nr:hypothetical protein SAMN05216584_10878 [Selenomonas ruminantium]
MGEKVSCVLIYMYFLFNIQLAVFTESIGKLIYHGLPIIILLVFWRYTKRMLAYMRQDMIKILFVLLLFVGAMIWGLLMVVLQNGEPSGLLYLGNAISGIFRFLALTVLIMRVYPQNTYENFMKIYVFCNVIYVTASVVLLLLPDLKQIWSTMIITPDKMVEKGDMILNSTRYGLAGYSGFSNTLFCSISVWMCLYLLEMKQISRWWNVAIVVLLVGNMLYGRSGLIISLGMFLVMNLRILSIKRLKTLMIGIGGCGLLIAGAVWYATQEPILAVWIDWVSEPVAAFIDGAVQGEISFGGSGNQLVEEMWFLPDNDSVILIGDGRFINADGTYYMYTDAGPMRQMFFYGIIGSLLSYISLLLLLYIYYLRVESKIYRWHKFYVAILLILIAFMEFKGLTFNTYYGVILALLCSYNATNICTERRRNGVDYKRGYVGI